jgi:hypothetical protein
MTSNNKLLSVKENIAWREAKAKKQGGLCKITGLPLIRPVCDHSHATGRVRGVLSNEVNLFEGKAVNAWMRHVIYTLPKDMKNEFFYADCLRRMADYLEADYSKHPFHPSFTKDLVLKFKRLKGAEQSEICEGSNLAKRVKAFKAIIKENKDDLTDVIALLNTKDQNISK